MILATITIQEISGDGIFSKAKEAAKQTEKAEIIEKGKLELLYAQTDETRGTEEFENLMKRYDIDGEIKNDDGRRYIETKNGNIIYLSEINSEGLMRLPSAYQEVEYLESTGAQYIDTLVIPDNNIKVEYILTPNAITASRFYFGCWDNVSTNGRCNLFASSPGILQFGIGSGKGIEHVSYANFTVPDKWLNNKQTVIIENKKMYINGTLKATLTCDLTNEVLTFYIGKANDMNNRGGLAQCIHTVKLWDNNTLVRNLIPCYRRSDNVAGMYDLVNGVFYTNAGTGEFIVGPNVN